MIQQENIDILGTLSSNRLDLEASLSDGASECVMTSQSTIFRDLGDAQQHGSIRLANPIKERFSSFDECPEPLPLLCLRDTNPLTFPQLPSAASYTHDSTATAATTTPLSLKPLGCSSNYSISNALLRPSNSLLAAAPHIDFARYFQDFSSVALTSEPIDDFSVSSEINSILTNHDDDDDDSELGMYHAFSWHSQAE